MTSTPNGTRQTYSSALDVELAVYNYVQILGRAPSFLALTAKQWETLLWKNQRERRYLIVRPDYSVIVRLEVPAGERAPDITCRVQIVKLDKSEGIAAYRAQIARDNEPEALAA